MCDQNIDKRNNLEKEKNMMTNVTIIINENITDIYVIILWNVEQECEIEFLVYTPSTACVNELSLLDGLCSHAY